MPDPRAPLRSALREAESELAAAVGFLEAAHTPDNLTEALRTCARVQVALGAVRRGLGRLLLEEKGS